LKILVFSQRLKQEDSTTVETVFNKLAQCGFEIFILAETAEEINNITDNQLRNVKLISKKDLKALALDLVMTLGGDGTMLKAATLVCHLNLPIVGINLGRLGFLSSVEKSKVEEAIDKIKISQYSVEKRAMIEVQCNHPIFGDIPFALNDFTIHKRDTSSMITINTYIDGEYLNTYWADGVIVATPTGSTGYSLACGGPIIFPGSGNFVITPIAPHNLNVRPLVLQDNVAISFEIEGRADNFLCTLDSRFETITDDYKITIKKSNLTTKLLQLEGNNFMSTIREKLLWGIDKRN
jgi:NAD+ kinase